MATHCRTRAGLVFQPKLAVDFDGGELTSEAGLLLMIREFDARLGLSQSIAGCVDDRRHASYVRHPLDEVLRQRLYQIIAGYEDANDATALRRDPTMQVVAGCGPGAELSSQPTLSRLKNAVDWASIYRLPRLPIEWFVRHGLCEIGQDQKVVIDVDSTDDPTHGQQALSFFNGHYGGYIDHPLLIFEETTGHLLGARLRPGDVGGTPQLPPAGRAACCRRINAWSRACAGRLSPWPTAR